jgi:polysaccharide export outer membrane protein
LIGSHTVLDLISAAGGPTPTGGKAVTITHKSDPEHPVVTQLDNKPGSVAAPVDVQPGDTVSVARAGVVYVVGDVAKAGGFLIEGNDRLTALQALALAQGANRTASQNKSRLIRKATSGRIEFSVPLKLIVQGKAVDPILEDGDILFIPSSGVKIWEGRGVDAVIGLTSGLAISGRY